MNHPSLAAGRAEQAESITKPAGRFTRIQPALTQTPTNVADLALRDDPLYAK
ncbi:hypothetical protein FMEAI12_4850014 [Parafrankia sp. Ea1.12]|nr:hypothetical protein FMEAI12_4850014 [Parafrankia sp. Ea1.12]